MIISILSAVGAAPAARAQVPAATDTVSANVPSLTATTKYNGGIKGNVTRVELANRFNATFAFTSGLLSMTTLSASESHYRLQDRQDTNKSFNSNLVYPVMPGLLLDGTLSDTRFFNRVITFSNATQDLKNNTQKAQANAQYGRSLGWGFTGNSRASVATGRSEQTYLNDQTEEGSIRAGVDYSMGRFFTASAKGFIRRTSLEAISGAAKYQGLGAVQDSVLVSARFVLTDSSVVRMEYMRYTSDDDYLELPRGAFGQQQFDQEVTPENEKKDVRSILISGDTKPLPGVTLAFSATHSDRATYFFVDKRRTRRDTGDRLDADLVYQPFAKTRISVGMEKSDYFHWLGPEKAGSFFDEDKKLKFNWDQGVTANTRLSMQTGVSLVQSVYVDTDRDRDQRYAFANARLSSQLWPQVNAAVYISVAKTDFVNISASLSQNNRAETTYEFRPEFTYRINDRLQLSQKYGLSIQYSDFVFQEDENFLDRNITFANNFRARLTTNLTADFFYSLRLHSKGSYLSPYEGAEKVLDINQEDRRDEVSIGFRYQLNKNLALIGLNEYGQRRDLMATAGRNSLFKDGGIEFGVEGNYDLGAQRGLKLAMRRVKRFGRFNADAQKDYWVMNSSLDYTF
jgi:hypothetical protein